MHRINALVAGLGCTLLAASPAAAAITTSVTTNTAPTVSSTDLLETALASSSVTGYAANSASFAASEAVLHDGAAHTNNIKNPESQAMLEASGSEGNGWTATFGLDLTASPLGYKLEQIVSYSSWDSVIASQHFTIRYSLVGDAAFVDLATVATTQNNKYVQVTVSDPDDGVLATGVDAIQFVSNPAGGTGNEYRGSFRELDVIGSAVPEPASLALMALGSLLLTSRRR